MLESRHMRSRHKKYLIPSAFPPLERLKAGIAGRHGPLEPGKSDKTLNSTHLGLTCKDGILRSSESEKEILQGPTAGERIVGFIYFPRLLVQRGVFNKFPDVFGQAFEIVVDSWKFTMLLLYILWDDWPIFMISASNK